MSPLQKPDLLETSLRVVSLPSLREQVAARLREAIVSGRFKPGERLIERQLCELMGVSRTSLREALRELEAEGLVTTRPNRGPIVSPLSIETAEAVYQVRAVLEGLAARLFARRASNAQIEQIKKAAESVAETYLKFDVAAAVKAKAEFYRILLDGAGNEIAASMLRSVLLRVSQLRSISLAQPHRGEASIRGVRRLVAALEARDEEAAWQACIAHVEGAAAAALAVLSAQSEGGALAQRG